MNILRISGENTSKGKNQEGLVETTKMTSYYFDQNIGERKPIWGDRYRSYAQRNGYMAMGSTTPQPPPAVTPDDEEDGINCSPCCDNENISRTFRAILLGQLLSICLCGTGVSSQLLSNAGINAPAAQNLPNYLLLFLVYGTALFCKGGENGFAAVMRARGWKYFILALIDVEANYLIVLAYKYTTLTSVQLLDCMTIPTVLLLSWLFLSVRYLISHIVGVCICLLGIACLIWADILDGKGSIGGSDRPLGDLLCIGGSLLYSVSNISEEFLVKSHSRVEYLAMMGTFGSLIAAIQAAVLEVGALGSITWTGSIVGYFALYACSMFVFSSFVTVVLQRTSALMFNLSTLTADFYSLLFALFLFKDKFHFLYFVSFIVVISGSVLYSLRPTEIRDPDEPRRVCPCFFSCCVCSDCCFETGEESSRGSINVTASSGPPASVPANSLALYMQHTDSRFCPVHGQRQNQTPIMQMRHNERPQSLQGTRTMGNGRLYETRT